MNSILMPSLQHAASVHIAAILWNQIDVKFLMICFYSKEELYERITELRENWSKIECKVLEKLPELPVPRYLKRNLICFIKSIGAEILNWIEYHNNSLDIETIPVKFYFTSLGAVDKKRTAEMFFKDRNLNDIQRYKLACLYCLKDEILESWAKVPADEQVRLYRQLVFYAFLSRDGPEQDIILTPEQELVFYWTSVVKENLSQTNAMRNFDGSCHQYLFKCAAMAGNKVATEYFFQILTPEEKAESLVRIAIIVAAEYSRFCLHHFKTENCGEVFCFLFLQMNEDQQAKIFTINCCQALMCLLEWPRQNLFIKVANQLWNREKSENSMVEQEFRSILSVIINKIKQNGFNYEELFEKLWQESPDSYKKYVLQKCEYDSLLSVLFKLRNKNLINLVFHGATLSEKKQIFYSSAGQKICQDLIENEEWDIMRHLIENFVSSEQEILRIKKVFLKLKHEMFQKHYIGVEGEKKKISWLKFLRLIDDCKFEKRK